MHVVAFHKKAKNVPLELKACIFLWSWSGRYEKCLWWHFTARARNVHLKLKTSTFLRISVKRLGLIYVVAFHQKGQKCTFRVTNLHIVVDLE